MAVAERILDKGLFELRSDKSLVRAAQSGKSDAYAALVTRYYSKVYSFVTHLIGTYRHRASAPSPEDLTQEVFARALNALGRFNGDYRFGPWLLRIARNLCVDEVRRDAHRAEPADPTELPKMESPESAHDNVWEMVSQSQAAAIVRSALSKLPERQRTVLILKELEGWSYNDIARVVGTNVRGVEATLRRARARFRMEAANVESMESERAICRRVAYLAASEPANLSDIQLAHIKRCEKCRARDARIRNADKLFGLLPPVAAPVSWRRALADSLRSKPKIRGVVEGARSAFTSPITQVAEIAAAIAVATAIAISTAPGVRTGAATSTTAIVRALALEAQNGPASEAGTSSSSVSSVRAYAQPAVTQASPGSPLDDQDSSLIVGVVQLSAISPALADLDAWEAVIALPVDVTLESESSVVLEALEDVTTIELGSSEGLPEGDLVPPLEPVTSGVSAALPASVATPRRREHPAT